MNNFVGDLQRIISVNFHQVWPNGLRYMYMLFNDCVGNLKTDSRQGWSQKIILNTLCSGELKKHHKGPGFFSPLNLQKIARTLEIERTHVPLTLLTSLERAILPPDTRQSKEDKWLNNKIFVVLPFIKIKKSHISWAKFGPYHTWSFKL